MNLLPDPPILPGIEWRPPVADDAQALADHTRLIHEAERLQYLPGPDFFGWLLEQPGIDSEHDMLVGLLGGRIVADTGTWLHSGENGARCIIWAEASPDHGDLKPFLLEWSEVRARQRLSGMPDDLPRVLRISVEEHRTAQRQAIEAAGFDSPRSFADMARPLTDLPPAPGTPNGIEVVGWSADLEEMTRVASNESFADHWGSVPMNAEEFTGLYAASPGFRGDLSFLALDEGKVVSFCLCEVDEEDNADRDTNDLYIGRVGTIPSHRGQHLAGHLIVRAMEAATQAGGLDRAALDVDEMSHTNATAIYERLGFKTYARSLNYVKAIGD